MFWGNQRGPIAEPAVGPATGPETGVGVARGPEPGPCCCVKPPPKIWLPEPLKLLVEPNPPARLLVLPAKPPAPIPVLLPKPMGWLPSVLSTSAELVPAAGPGTGWAIARLLPMKIKAVAVARIASLMFISITY